MKDTPISEERLEELAKQAIKLGFYPDRRRPGFFIRKSPVSGNIISTVDLTASGTDFESVAKNITYQMFQYIEDEKAYGE